MAQGVAVEEEGAEEAAALASVWWMWAAAGWRQHRETM